MAWSSGRHRWRAGPGGRARPGRAPASDPGRFPAAVRRHPEDHHPQVLLDVVEVVGRLRSDEHDRTRPDAAILLPHAEVAAARNHAVDLVLLVGRLAVARA